MEPKRDEINKNLLKEVIDHPKSSIRDIITPFLYWKSETALRYRIRSMQLAGWVECKKTDGEYSCRATPAGMAECKEWSTRLQHKAGGS